MKNSVLALLILVACGADNSPIIVEVVEPVRAHYLEFTYQMDKHMAKDKVASLKSVGIIIKWAKHLSKNVIGRCHDSGKNIPTVEILQSEWLIMNDYHREQLLFHELGHCILKRGHKNTRRTDGVVASIMNTYHIGGTMYRDNREYYIKELFNGR